MSGHHGPPPRERLNFEERVVAVLRALQPGEVVSYEEVAAEAGTPGAARAVGNVLRRRDGLPWWRVVAASGRLVPGLEATQARLLQAEGVTVTPALRVPVRPLQGHAESDRP
ncbi:MAG: MGMT family protein [Acidimicrobiia bacterium]